MKRIFSLLFLLVFYSAISQNPKIDSLLGVLKTAKEDTGKVWILNNLSIQFINTDIEKAKTYNNEAYALALKLKDKKGLSNVYHFFGLTRNSSGDPDSAIYYHTKALELRTEIRWKKGIATSNANIGQSYYSKGDYKSALTHYISSVKIAEEIMDTLLCANFYNNIGLIYKSTNTLDLALEYFQKSIALKKRMHDRKGIANGILNMGIVYNMKDELKLSEKHYREALSIFIELNNLLGQGLCYNNLGAVLYDMKDYKGALESNLKSLEIKNTMKDEAGIASSLLNIGSDYYQLKDLKKAKENHFKALEIMERLDLKEPKIIVYEMLSKDFEASNDLANALSYYKKYNALKDTVFNIEKSEQLTDIQTKYDSEKKDKEIIRANSLLREKELETKQKETQRNAFVGGFVVVILLLGIVFRSNRQRRRANIEINRQKEIIEEKQREIIDSIHYAKRIQTALITSEKYFDKNLNKLQDQA